MADLDDIKDGKDWGADRPAGMLAALAAVVHDGEKPERAYQLFQDTPDLKAA